MQMILIRSVMIWTNTLCWLPDVVGQANVILARSEQTLSHLKSRWSARDMETEQMFYIFNQKNANHWKETCTDWSHTKQLQKALRCRWWWTSLERLHTVSVVAYCQAQTAVRLPGWIILATLPTTHTFTSINAWPKLLFWLLRCHISACFYPCTSYEQKPFVDKTRK